jgi:hypothetical protein
MGVAVGLSLGDAVGKTDVVGEPLGSVDGCSLDNMLGNPLGGSLGEGDEEALGGLDAKVGNPLGGILGGKDIWGDGALVMVSTGALEIITSWPSTISVVTSVFPFWPPFASGFSQPASVAAA